MTDLQRQAASIWQGSDNLLAPHYQKFNVAQHLRFTGHSHQAWPDCSWLGQQQAWLDAAELVDQKWAAAQRQADLVRAGFGVLLSEHGDINLGVNTHELLVRFISALPLRDKPRIVTTCQEFHSMRRQLDSLAQWGLDIVKVDIWPRETFSERLLAQVDSKTAAVMCSWVAFEDAAIVPLQGLASSIKSIGAEFLVDVYHGLNVLPLDVSGLGLEQAFLLGGGYKYCQMGEGNCFLSVPKDSELLPVVTGWYSEFAELTEPSRQGGLRYGRAGERFSGATYDPSSHYRAAKVFDFFVAENLTPDLLREINLQQKRYLIDALQQNRNFSNAWSVAGAGQLSSYGGFLALAGANAQALFDYLKRCNVVTDIRGQSVRIGPAPYHSQQQLSQLADTLLAFSSR